MRWARDGKTATSPPVQEDVEILTGLEHEPLDGRQPHKHLHDIGGQQRKPLHPAGQRLDIHFPDTGNESSLDHEIGQGSGLTEQDVAGELLGGCDSGGPALRISDLASPQQCAARAAMARFAAVRKVEARIEGGLQHRLPRARLDRACVRLDANRALGSGQSGHRAGTLDYGQPRRMRRATPS